MSKELKSEKITLRVRPSVLELAERVYFNCNPYADEARLDELFEMLVTEYESGHVITQVEKVEPREIFNEAQEPDPTLYESSNDDIVDSILR